mgnify:CR=1 FL=1
MIHFKRDFIDFFIELASNNNKEWFDANRVRYEKNVRDPFKDFVQHIIDLIAKDQPEFKEVLAKDCIFRINRDIRFSKDKTPYKMMVSAVVAPEGKKSKAVNGVYFELSPEHVRVYGGIYEIDKDDLYSVREGIVANLKEFQQAYNHPQFKKVFGKILGDTNKLLPKEFKEAAEIEPLIFNKQWYFYAQFESDLILSDKLNTTILECFEAGKPVENFFNKLIKR